MPFEQLPPEEIKRRLDAGEKLTLIDVREQNEWDYCRIEGAVLKPMSLTLDWQDEIDKDGGPYVIICHHGVRSRRICQHLESLGVKNLINMAGGIDAWSKTVDASVPLY